MTTVPLRLAFAGTPAPAAVVLQSLLESRQHQLLGVYTQPDRPRGRGRKLQPGPVKQIAADHNIPVLQPASSTELSHDSLFDRIDALIVVAYGMLLPAAVLAKPRYGCLNIHFSLLPRWRGAAPVQRAILAGDHETGISLMQMDPGLDTGPILAQATCQIDDQSNSADLLAKLAELGADELLRCLPLLDELTPQSQSEEHACYARKLDKAEAELDWQQSAIDLARAVRAYNPAPIARARLAGCDLRIWQARALAASEPEVTTAPGTIVATGKQGIDVATSDGLLRIERLQVPGGKVLTAAEFLNGRPDFGICTD